MRSEITAERVSHVPGERRATFVIESSGRCALYEQYNEPPKPGETVIRVAAHVPSSDCPAFPEDIRERIQDEFAWFVEALLEKSGQNDNAPSRALAVIQDVQRLTEEELLSVSDERRQIMLQLYAADIRAIQEDLSPNHPFHDKLNQAIRKLTALTYRIRSDYVAGLGRKDQEDWHLLRILLRRKLAKCSAVQGTLSQRKRRKERPTPVGMTSGASEAAEDSELIVPKLKALIQSGKRVILLGGDQRIDKAERVNAWLRTEVEWPDLYGKTVPRLFDGIERSMRNGAYACVLIVNGMISHAIQYRVVSACKTSGTITAIVHRAGLDSIRQALLDVETRL